MKRGHRFITLATTSLLLAACGTVTPAPPQGDNGSPGDTTAGLPPSAGPATPSRKDVLWYRKAAAKGDVRAQTYLGYIHDRGLLGVTPNPYEALRWYRMAADQGDPEAQANLGYLYLHGRGTTSDPVAARDWFQRAAEQGSADAQANLGYLYAKGLGTAKDPEAAVRWYRLAAEQGHVEAQHNLGNRYFTGEGVPQDLEQAYVWYSVAARSDNPVADQSRQLAAAQLAPQALEDAQHKIQDLMKRLGVPSSAVSNAKRH
ncbi:MAG: sel1 repeat family protein [Magnetococcales bacterium]|nr:sel1 repeat family protein [Magnetococcales bacterium]